MSEHGKSERIGRDRYGFLMLRCECGTEYPAESGKCPVSPAERKLEATDKQ